MGNFSSHAELLRDHSDQVSDEVLEQFRNANPGVASEEDTEVADKDNYAWTGGFLRDGHGNPVDEIDGGKPFLYRDNILFPWLAQRN